MYEWLAIIVIVVAITWWLCCYMKVPNKLQVRSTFNDLKKDRWFLAITVGLLALVFNSPISYKLTGKATCGFTSDNNCCPTPSGLILHNILLIFVVRLMMW